MELCWTDGYHPHVHCLVTGGGISDDGRDWHPARKAFLVPHIALANTPRQSNRTDGKGRKRDNVVGIRALFVDLDGAPLAPVMQWALPPHIVVESSPGRYHGYWIVDETVALTEFTRLQKKLAKLFGGDPKVHDLPRVLRVAGFIHRKGEPFRTHVVHHNAALSRYSASELSTALGDVSVVEDERPTQNEVERPTRNKAERPTLKPAIAADQPANVQDAIDYLQNDASPAVAFEQGNNCTYATTCYVRGHFGLSEATCYDVMIKHFNPRCRPQWSNKELKAIVSHAYRYAQAAQGAESTEAEFADELLPRIQSAPLRLRAVLSPGSTISVPYAGVVRGSSCHDDQERETCRTVRPFPARGAGGRRYRAVRHDRP